MKSPPKSNALYVKYNFNIKFLILQIKIEFWKPYTIKS